MSFFVVIETLWVLCNCLITHTNVVFELVGCSLALSIAYFAEVLATGVKL